MKLILKKYHQSYFPRVISMGISMTQTLQIFLTLMFYVPVFHVSLFQLPV